MAHHMHNRVVTKCEIITGHINQEVSTLANIEREPGSIEVKTQLIEAKRKIVNSYLDEMLHICREKAASEA